MHSGRYTIIILLLLFLVACLKVEQYPAVPEIGYLSFEKITDEQGRDVSGILTFTFRDGDGNIGLEKPDTNPPFNPGSEYYYNFYVFYFEKFNGQYVEIELPFVNHQRIPDLTPKGQNKAIKGEIDLELFINNPFALSDTIMFEFFIYDRSLNKSNIERTPDIVVSK